MRKRNCMKSNWEITMDTQRHEEAAAAAAMSLM